MDILNSLCRQFDECKVQVAKGLQSNGIILERLIDRITNLDSQESICQLLWCVTSILECVTVLSQDSESIINHVIVAMEKVPRSDGASFHEAACGTLANLAMLPTNHTLMNTLGVVSILCEEIHSFEHSEYVQSAACMALANLSSSLGIRAALLAEDGVNALLLSMKSAPDNVSVQCEAMRALNGLSLESPKSFTLGVHIIISTFICHSDDKYIQKVACSILRRLSVNDKCRATMITSRGMFETLIQIQKLTVTNVQIQTDIICLLGNLSFEESAISAILNRGFLLAIVKAMDLHSSCVELLESACDVFWRVASYSPEAKIQVCSDGGLQCIAKVRGSIYCTHFHFFS
jgi:hypothetical protein